MRFRTQLRDSRTFSSESNLYHQNIIQILIKSELTASLASLGKVCWMRLEHEVVRFTIIPDQGTQVWASIPVVRT
jgi:HUS1 checkpoint protein